MNSNIIIRKETEADYYNTEFMVRRSFWNIHGPACNEHLLVRVIRESDDYLPEFSRVAEMDGKIVGAVYYSKAKLVDGDKVHELATFGPLAVEPAMQGQGIGRLLLEETLKLLKEAGYPAVIIMGEPHYYPKLGFRHCGEFGIVDANGNCWDAMLAYPLDEAAFSEMHGVFYESEDIPKCDDEERLAEMEKSFPEYPKIKIQEGFLQIYDKRFGFVKSAENGNYVISFFEKDIPAVTESDFPEDAEKPKVGDVVLFKSGKDGAVITDVCENMI